MNKLACFLLASLGAAVGLRASPPSEPPPMPATSQAASAPVAKPIVPTTATSQPAVYGKPMATAINPPESITYKAANYDISALLITPRLPRQQDPKTGPAIILVHDIFGITPFIKAQAEMYAKQGYTVLVPNLYSRLDNSGKALDAAAAAADYEKTSDQQATSDLAAAVGFLENVPPEGEPPSRPIAVVGYDMGGIYAMMMASDFRVTCAVNFYGRILYSRTSKIRPSSPVDTLFNIRAPLLNFYGALDPQCPQGQIDALESRLAHNLKHTFYETIRYPDAGHGFMKPGSRGYDKNRAAEAAEKTRAFLAEYLRAQPKAAE